MTEQPDSISPPLPDFVKILENVGGQEDGQIDLGACALALAHVDVSERNIERYWRHLQKLTAEVKSRHQKLLDNGGENDVRTQLAALKHTIADKHGYVGDAEFYDNLQNANLIHVIDRRKGMPITLSIIYLHVAIELGWAVHALNFPAHVVCAIEKNGEKLLFDPFNQCRLMNASDLRQYLKTLVSEDAELSSDYYKATSRRNVLIRLQNNIKLRQIEAEDYEAAVHTVELMRKIDPSEYRLLFDAGILYARIDKPVAAVRALENYIEAATDRKDKDEAYSILYQIRSLID